MSKTTDPNLAKFLGTDRIRSLSDEELCQLVREYYRLPAPSAPGANPPTSGTPSPAETAAWAAWGVVRLSWWGVRWVVRWAFRLAFNRKKRK